MGECVCVGVACGAVRRRAGGLAGERRVGQVVLASTWRSEGEVPRGASSIATPRPPPVCLSPGPTCPASIMGFQQASPSPSPQRAASPPSGAASKGRRPSSLSVGSSTPSKTSSGRPSPSRSPVPKRTGSVSKASTPPGKPLTCAQGPVLATEARSKVRPCGCSRRHGAGHHHPQEIQKESPRRKSKNETPVKSSSLAPSSATKSEQTSLTPLTAQSDKAGNNRYVSTLVWVPRLTPFTYSTTLVVSAQDPAFSEVICIKQGGACSNLAEARKH